MSDFQAFELINPEAVSDVLLVCDHASRALPPGWQPGIDAVEMRRHIAWDIGAADVTRRLAARTGMPAVLSTFSRLYIDPNRELDDPTSIVAHSDGVDIPANQAVTDDERARRQALAFWPYQNAVGAAVDRLLDQGRVPLLMAIHSFTPVYHAMERPWHVGILWNRDPRVAQETIRWFRREPDMVVGDNEPYSAQTGPGETMNRHAQARGLPHALLEIRQDLIDTHHGADDWAAHLHRLVEHLLSQPDLMQVQEY